GFELLPPFRIGASASLSLWGRQACGFSCREVVSDSRYDPWGLNAWSSIQGYVAGLTEEADPTGLLPEVEAVDAGYHTGSRDAEDFDASKTAGKWTLRGLTFIRTGLQQLGKAGLKHAAREAAKKEAKREGRRAARSAAERVLEGPSRQRDERGRFLPEPAAEGGRHSRGTEYPHEVDPRVRAEVIRQHTNARGEVIDPQTGAVIPPDQFSIEHKRKVAEHWNDEGHDIGRAERKRWYNDPSNLTVKERSENSSEGARAQNQGLGYRQETGSNYRRN
ncbi:MAG: GH-E family nuclease, partial [Thermoanaerobaculia bacterium]